MLIYNTMTIPKEYFTVYNIIAIILAVIGLIWVIYGIWRNSKINKINSWPKTNARIIGSVLQPSNDKSVMIDPTNIAVINKSLRYIPRVTYEYTIGNTLYQSNSVVYSGQHTYDANAIAHIMSKLMPGSVIPIFYNPNNFSESYIYNGVSSYTSIGIGLILLLLAAYLAYYHKNLNKYKSNDAIVVNKPRKRKEINEVSPKFTEGAPKLKMPMCR